MKLTNLVFLVIIFLFSCKTMEPQKKISRGSRNPSELRTQSETQSDISYYKQRSPGASRVTQSGILNKSDALRAIDGRHLREVEERRSSGSLWSENSKSNFLFITDQSKNIGDIIYINLKEDLQAMLRQNTKRQRVTNVRTVKRQPARARGPKPPLNKQDKGGVKNQQQGALNPPKPRTRRPNPGTPTKNTLIAARVIDKLANGVLLVEGHKLVDVNKIMRQILVSGYVRESDINQRDEVDSRKMADLSIDYVVAKK